MEKYTTTIYVSFDGVEFDTEEECVQYEKHFHDSLKALHIFDQFGNECSKELDKIGKTLADAYYLQVDNEDGFDALEIYNDYGFPLPNRKSASTFPAKYYYDTHTEEWDDAQSIIDLAHKLTIFFGGGNI